MIAIPLPLAVIFPKESTLTTLLFDEYQFMTAPHGKAVTSILPELLPDETLLLKLMYGVYAGAGFLTVTVQEAYFPLLVFAVIVAVPAFHAVTFPPETDATELLLLLQDTDLFVTLEGLIVAANEKKTPLVSVIFLQFNATLLTTTVLVELLCFLYCSYFYYNGFITAFIVNGTTLHRLPFIHQFYIGISFFFSS